MSLIQPISVRQRLARATAPDHNALHVHPWISKLAQPDLDLGTYAKVLRAYHAFFLNIEVVRHDLDAFSQLSLGLQIEAMEDDLHGFNFPIESPQEDRVPLRNDAPWGVLGALYVLHGAGFGAKTLNSNVKTALPHASRKYLSLGTPTDVWRNLISQLERSQGLGREQGVLFEGASETFKRFGQSVTTYCEGG